mmetsp:Transcript_13703/g.29423  ORF Transcript_13703/g.29423 Transcript_13703/m.29423 type:complete len:593 (+) Transcript_13703:48-1826(+)|eukprot:CAMPEP_0202897626 /NCGR_PEP_ID=MMETSP1392-20130828/6336_1 /ASSEMBLY_ACC=CAM_ASM_000868 /TAXON_ID=225041 /ORGANISM="Chlamydomonas chlamydogama, Strain SAG 11-48b" /LENGTH=592 /DNA_ID=CAMNT_0049583311 /DNA_START=44 /DNA_END=1822 /DNA_ORIENTATION=-
MANSLRPAAGLLALAALSALFAAAISVKLDTTYRTLLTSGQTVNGKVFAQTKTFDGKPIYATDYEKSQVLDRLEISHAVDFSALVKMGNQLYLTVQTEFFPPSNLFIVKVKSNSSGLLTATDMETVDFSEWGGLWLACSGQLVKNKGSSSYKVLGAEEYEPNARHFSFARNLTQLRSLLETDPYFYGYADVVNFMRYFGVYPFANNLSLPVITMQDVQTKFNPYAYGYVSQLDMRQGMYRASKLYTLGRISHEMAYVMPDRMTVYLPDDHSTGGGFFMFRADKAGDFSKGSLYSVKLTQLSPSKGAPQDSLFNVTWVLLGKGNQADLTARVDKVTFSDIFDVASPNASFACPAGFSSVNTATGFECLKLKAGKEVEAAFFETRRYAALVGGTTEFSKLEGLSFDSKTGTVFMAMSVVRRHMEDNMRQNVSNPSFDRGGPNHVRLGFNPCGCIFGMHVDAKTMMGHTLKGVLCGSPIARDAQGNTCSTSSIAGPDNLQVLRNQKLIIAEDSEGLHINNVLWAMDIATGNLTQMYRVPAPGYSDAEFTGNYVYHIGGKQYMMTNINNYDKSGGVPGAIGYFGPWTIKENEIIEL